MQEISRKKPNPKNRVDEAVEQAVIELAVEQPAFGQLRASNELKKRAAAAREYLSLLVGYGPFGYGIERPLETFPGYSD